MKDKKFGIERHRIFNYKDEEIISKVFKSKKTEEKKEAIKKLLEVYFELLGVSTIRATGEEYKTILGIIEGSPFLKCFLIKKGKNYFKFGDGASGKL